MKTPAKFLLALLTPLLFSIGPSSAELPPQSTQQQPRPQQPATSPPPPASQGSGSPQQGATPSVEPKQTPTQVFIPSAGYTRTIQKQQYQRAAAARQPIQGAPKVAGLAGKRPVPVICVNFHNVPPPFPIEAYKDLLFGTRPNQKSMTRYYSDISSGKLQLIGSVFGWYELPNDDTY